MMMQNTQKDTIHGIFSSTSITIPKFITSFISQFKTGWIIDSGATDHISTKLTFMINIHTFTKPIFVTLPNGHTTKVTTYGSVIINADITLHNLLYVPSFAYNLISVSQLLKGTTISLTLTATQCIFQDKSKMIALGTLCDGLYMLPTSPKHTICSTSTQDTLSTLWHSRLGH